MEGYGIEVEEAVSGIDGAMTYQVFVTTPTSTDVVNAILGNELNPIVLASSSEIYQNASGSALPSPASMFAFFPMLEYDSFVTLGEETPADAMEFPPTSDGSDPAWVTSFENGGNIEITDAVGSGWYMNANVMGQYGVAGDDNRVMVAQLTTPGSIHGQLYVQIFPEGLSAGNTVYVNLSFGSAACGCTDPMACNYEADNVTDDGSCFYAAEGENCGATCLYDYSDPEVIAFEETYTTSCEDADTDVREPVFADNCDDLLDVTMSDVLFEGDCNGSYTIERTWMAVDNVGNSTSAVQTINVVDETAPSFTVPADLSVSCTAAGLDPAETGDVSDAEDCSGTAEVTFEDVYSTDGCFANNVVTRTWTAVDDCGNATSQEQIITLVDDNAPYFTNVPAAVALTCGDELPTENATAADACSDVTVTFSDADGDMTCSGLSEVIRTFTAMDACGNSSTAVQVITFVDDEAPTGAATDATVSCSEYDSSAEFGSYETSDNCSGDVTVTWMETSSTEDGQAGCFEVVREYTFTDACGNSSTAMQSITVVDDEAPVLSAIDAEVVLQCGDAIPDAPTATDNCSSVEVTFVDADNGLSCSGEMSFIRTYTATDACGNSSSVTQSISYDDVIAPTFTAPADVTLECDSDLSDLALTGDVMDAADVCSADIYVAYTDASSTSEGSCLADNVVTRTWTVTDGCGNSASADQIITLEDTTAPVVTYDANVILENVATSELDDFEGVEVMDACSDWTYTSTDTWLGNSLTGYELNRVMVITDACGNSTTIEQSITAVYATGCTYMDAENYDAAAIVDDGSCEYAGCTDMASANYNPIASIDDGSCVTVGCMDPDGYDYDPNANYPGGCDYPDPCPGDINDDGFVNVGDLLEFFQYYGQICDE